jgi:hypothetical protein
MNDIVLYPGRVWSVLLAILCIFGALLCTGVLVFQGEVQTEGGTLIKVGLGALFLWGAFFVNIYRLFNRRASFIVNREGITERATPLNLGLIRWDEIAGITVHHGEWVNLLGIMLKDPETFCSRMPADTAAALRAGFKRHPVHIGIAQAALPEDVDTLAQRILAYREALTGAPRPAPAPVPVPAPAPPPPAGPLPGQRCSACGATSQGSKFCPDCGQPMVQKPKCSKCGTEVNATTKFCPECGSKIGL